MTNIPTLFFAFYSLCYLPVGRTSLHHTRLVFFPLKTKSHTVNFSLDLCCYFLMLGMISRDSYVGYSLLMKTLNLFCACEFKCVCVCVSQQLCIIKINDIVHLLPKHRHTHTSNKPSWRSRLCFSKRTIFCLPLWLSLSRSLFISPSISISLSAQNAKLLHFSLAPLLPCSSTHLVINS